MSSSEVTPAAIVVCVLIFACGVGFVLVMVAWRRGRIHLDGESDFFDEGLLGFQRNFLLSLLPLSVAACAVTAMPLTVAVLRTPFLEVLSIVEVFVFVAAGLVGLFVAAVWVPPWLKPTWMRERERDVKARRKIAVATGDTWPPDDIPFTATPAVPAAVWWILGAACFGFGLAIPVFHWPPTWEVGPLFASAALLRMRRSRR